MGAVSTAVRRTVTICLLLALVGCASAPAPSLKGVKGKVRWLDPKGMNLRVDVEVKNPYPVPLKVVDGRYTVDVGRGTFTRTDAISKSRLPMLGVGTIKIPVRIEFDEIRRFVDSLAEADQVPYTLDAQVTVSALGKRFDLPIAYADSFPIPVPMR